MALHADGPQPRWRKSTRSVAGSGNCVEVATAEDGVYLRDSKDPDGGVLTFNRDSWVAFLAGLRAGEFSPPPGSDDES